MLLRGGDVVATDSCHAGRLSRACSRKGDLCDRNQAVRLAKAYRCLSRYLSINPPLYTKKEVLQHLQIQLNQKTKSKNHLPNIIKKKKSVKDQSVSILWHPCFFFFDLCPCRRPGTQRQRRMIISVRTHPSALSTGLKWNTYSIPCKHGLFWFENGHGACPGWATCLPHLGTIRSWPVPKTLPKIPIWQSKPNHYDLPQKHQTKYHKNTKRFPRNYKQNTSKT